MRTEDLIESLARDVKPIARNMAQRRIVEGTAGGALIALIALALTLGVRPDLDIAMAGPMFWMKIGYTASIALVSLAAAAVLTRPEAKPPGWLWLVVLPVALLGMASTIEMAAAPSDHRMGMWFGNTWQACPLLVLALAVPIMAALMLGYRNFAPTRLRVTGAVIGLGSGAVAATVYCFHCPESTASFVLTWYSLGIAMSAALGAALGPRFLRW